MPQQIRQWQAMHMGRQGKPKVAHRYWYQAALHKRSHVRRTKIAANQLSIYPCWFTDDNHFAQRRHWHIGHTPGSRKLMSMFDPRAIAVQGGWRFTVVLTEEEIARLEVLAGDAAVQEFAARAIIGLARTATVCCHVDPAGCMRTVSRNSQRGPEAQPAQAATGARPAQAACERPSERPRVGRDQAGR